MCVAGEPYSRCAPRPPEEKTSIALSLAITLAAMVGAFVMFGEIVDYLSNRRKRAGPGRYWCWWRRTSRSSELWETMGAAGYRTS